MEKREKGECRSLFLSLFLFLFFIAEDNFRIYHLNAVETYNVLYFAFIVVCSLIWIRNRVYPRWISFVWFVWFVFLLKIWNHQINIECRLFGMYCMSLLLELKILCWNIWVAKMVHVLGALGTCINFIANSSAWLVFRWFCEWSTQMTSFLLFWMCSIIIHIWM